MADGARTAWATEVPLGRDVSTVHGVVAPALPTGLGLLLARVWYDSPEGRTSTVSLSGQFVEVTARGLVPTAQRFEAVHGSGLIADPHDSVEIDEEAREASEAVTR